MPLSYHPKPGTIVICDFNRGFVPPEMVKKRPALVISPKFRKRNNLCTIIPFSTTIPDPIMPYHYRLCFDPPLPSPYNSSTQWAKGDMLYTVSFDRLSMPFVRKKANGKRIYDIRTIDEADFIKIKKCVLNALGMTNLTEYL